MHRGFIKLWRRLLSSPIWKNSTSDQRSVLIAIMLSANHSKKSWEWKGQPFTIQPGQLITSIKSLCDLSGNGVTPQNVRSALKRFEKLEFLTNESTKTGRLITVLNWDTYNPDSPLANKGPTCRNINPAAELSEKSPNPTKNPTKTLTQISNENSDRYDSNCPKANIAPNRQPTKTQQRPNKQVTPNKNEEECKKGPALDFSNLRQRYTDQDLINRAFSAIASTRKLGKVADSVLSVQLTKWARYPVAQVEAGIRTYLKKRYHEQGKREEYLLGIIRGKNGNRTPIPHQPAPSAPQRSIAELLSND